MKQNWLTDSWWNSLVLKLLTGLPRWISGQESTCHCRSWRRHGFDLWVRKIPGRKKWQPTAVFLPEKSYGQRSLEGYSPCRATVHGVSKSQTQLSDSACVHDTFERDQYAFLFSGSVLSDSATLWTIAHQDLPKLGTEPASSVSPALQVDSLPPEPETLWKYQPPFLEHPLWARSCSYHQASH